MEDLKEENKRLMLYIAISEFYPMGSQTKEQFHNDITGGFEGYNRQEMVERLLSRKTHIAYCFDQLIRTYG